MMTLWFSRESLEALPEEARGLVWAEEEREGVVLVQTLPEIIEFLEAYENRLNRARKEIREDLSRKFYLTPDLED